MATYTHNDCAPSWQGNYNAAGANQNGPTWVTRELSVTAAQAVANNLFRLIKLDRNTIVLDGYMTCAGMDVHATPTATVDLGFESDADGDGDTDVVDFFVDGLAIAAASAAVTKNFDTNDLGTTGPFVPVDTLTSDSSINGGYFITAKLLGAVATAGAGTIKVGLLIADKRSMSSASE